MIKLFCFPRSGNSREVKLVLKEKGVSYQELNIREPEVKDSEEFKKASPKGTVPAIIDDGTYLSEAYTINEYLETKYSQSPLLPQSDDSKQEIREWVLKYDKELCLKIGLLLIETLLKPKERQSEDIKMKLREGIAKALEELNSKLEGGEYFFGELSLADISMLPHLSALPRVNYDLDESLLNLKTWLSKMQSRPSFQDTIE